jgi:hypothetical protein
MQDPLDQNLKSMFEEQKLNLPEEPFLGDTLKLIERRRSRRIVLQRLAYLLGLALCVYLSPFLIKGSTLLSGGLNAAFAAVSSFVTTSLGMSIVAIALLFLFFRRRRISRFV